MRRVGSSTSLNRLPQAGTSNSTPTQAPETPVIPLIVEDQLTSYSPSPSADIQIVGCELFARSALALSLGIVPYGLSKGGQTVVAKCAQLVESVDSYFEQSGAFGHLIGGVGRLIIGVPAAISGIFFFGGALLFALTQKVAWGTLLVEYPQEEHSNTKLARYGASYQPFYDFAKVWKGFFAFSNQDLSEIKIFEVP